MKTLFSQEVFIKAWNFASSAHRNQTLPGSDLPYINHIGNVTMEILAAVFAAPVAFPELAIQCALLHDTIEDTDITYDQIEAEFGENVASGVLSLSKNTDLPSKQAQMLDSISRIKEQPKEIWMVKLADRITNLQPPPHYWDQKKTAGYLKEAELIFDNLASAHETLEERLRQKIQNYSKYIK